MWALIRAAALLVLAVVVALVAGQGGWLLDAADAAALALGADPVAPRGSAPADLGLAVGVAVGAAAALARPGRRAVGQVVTLLHELGHTVVAAALGARPAGIVLRHDASGHATARWVGRAGPVRRLSLAAVAFVGLPSAAVASAAGAQALTLAGPDAVLWSLVAAGAVVAVLARSLWSLLVAAALAALAVAALSAAAAPWVGGAVVAALTAIAVRAALVALTALRRPIGPGDDARAVTRTVRLPAPLVQALQAAATVGGAAWAVWPLLPDPAALPLPG